MNKVIAETKELMLKHWIEENEVSNNYPLSQLVYEQLQRKLQATFGLRASNLIFDGLILEIINEKDKLT